METVLNLTLASLIRRLENGIPYWHGEWGTSSAEDWGRDKKEEILSSLLKQKFKLKADSRDLEYLLLHFYSLVFTRRDIPGYKVRCLVCCFEGIGLASYLQSILQRDIEGINIVEATAVFKIKQKYLDEKGIELILSTFPIRDIQTPVVPISLPIDRVKIKDEISRVVEEINKDRLFRTDDSPVDPPETIEGLSFEDVMRFIQDFGNYTFSEEIPPGEIIMELSDVLTDNRKSSEKLAVSFQKREDLGPLFFEEYGIRVIHCKSSDIDEAHAGIIQFDNDEKPRIIYMVAPDPCPDKIRKMLSVITISFMDNRRFRESIMRGTINQIRRNLMDIYKEMI